MNETNLRHCKICSQLKSRTENGKFGKSRNKRYVDENGKLWNGNVCPGCHDKKTAANMKHLRYTRVILDSVDKKDET